MCARLSARELQRIHTTDSAAAVPTVIDRLRPADGLQHTVTQRRRLRLAAHSHQYSQSVRSTRSTLRYFEQFEPYMSVFNPLSPRPIVRSTTATRADALDLQLWHA